LSDPRAATLTEGGGLRVEFDAPDPPELPPGVESSVTTDTRDVSVADGRLVQTIELTVDPDAVTAEAGSDESPACREPSAGPATGDETARDGQPGDALAAVRDESVPPYEDGPYLERLYETCDTFVEMSRRIDMDVSSETVRRYMIEAGVHSPTAYDGAGESGDDGGPGPSADATVEGPEDGTEGREPDPTATLPDEQLVTDGAGLPSDLRVADIVDAVAGSTTVYEVHRRLDVDQARTRELLGELNLLDLVMGRVAHARDNRITEDDVAARLRDCATEKH